MRHKELTRSNQVKKSIAQVNRIEEIDEPEDIDPESNDPIDLAADLMSI
jgi:hypothetical protein